MADVIVIFWADVIALFFLFKFEIFGRCYVNMTMDCHCFVLMADVIYHWQLMECHCCVMWLMLLPLKLFG